MRTSGQNSSMPAKPVKIVIKPLKKTLALSFVLSSPKRMTAKLTPRLTTGISRLVTLCIILVTPSTSGLSSA